MNEAAGLRVLAPIAYDASFPKHIRAGTSGSESRSDRSECLSFAVVCVRKEIVELNLQINNAVDYS